jgi:hypothetical protein
MLTTHGGDLGHRRVGQVGRMAGLVMSLIVTMLPSSPNIDLIVISLLGSITCHMIGARFRPTRVRNFGNLLCPHLNPLPPRLCRYILILTIVLTDVQSRRSP